VPEKVIMIGEARSHDFKKLKAQVLHMKKTFARACRSHKAKLEIETTHSYRAFRISDRAPIFRMAFDAARAIGIKPEMKKTGGGSDGNVFNSYGVRTLIIGTGADRVHTSLERLSIDQMIRSVEFVTQIIKEVAIAKK
jgi:tripeptide aminopeptidase